jgi:hypothetical protein
MEFFPQHPEGPEAVGEMPVRFEDVTQLGRVTLECLPTAISSVVWPKFLSDIGAKGRGPTDVLPILSRLIIHSEGGPVAAHRPLEGKGTYQLCHSRNPAGDVDRILINMWVTLSGVVGHTHGFPVKNAGAPVQVGRVFAEHVFTRPFAPPAERRVLELDPGIGFKVPPTRYEWRTPQTVLASGENEVEWLDDAIIPDASVTALGFVHTDSNQHVNSLVYPRLFEDAALRRLFEYGHKSVLGRSIELMFRKPCFSGERVQVSIQAGRIEGGFIVRGFVHAPGEPPDKGRAYARLVLTSI